MQEEVRKGSEFLWRRLEEPPELFGVPLDFDPMWWLAAGIPLLLLSLVLVYALYLRDSRAVGLGWGMLLAFLRTATFLSLFFIWLLPAVREVEWTEQRSRVLVLFDVSASMQSSDDPPTDSPGQLRTTRQEQLIKFLQPEREESETAAEPKSAKTTATSKRSPEVGRPSQADRAGRPGKADLLGSKADFLTRLLEKNPLYCYRFGEQLDDKEWAFRLDDPAERLHRSFDWRRKLQPTIRPLLADAVFPEIAAEFHKAAELLKQTEGLEESAQERRRQEIVKDLEKAIDDDQQLRERLLNRTNLGEALLHVLRKESGNMVQGLIVFSDGHNNAGSSQDIQEAVKLAKSANVPIFTVGVGYRRDTFNVRLADVLAPSQVQPEDEFPVRVVVEGENLPKQQEVEVRLDIEKPPPEKEKPQPEKPEKPETMTQKISLVEGESGRATGTAEFIIKNPDKLAVGKWKFQARVTAIKGERSRGDNRSEEPTIVEVTLRKPRILLFASGPMRDYQFLRTLLVRERDKFDLSIHLQIAEGGVVQDVDPKKLLADFPTDLRDGNDDPMNLGNYDVIVAFDPDWRKLPEKTRTNLKNWVENFAGGLIVVAGPVHTYELARDKELAAIQELYPVELDDKATAFTVMERTSKEPWALNWGPAAGQQNFLDLKETGDKTKTLEGWEEFFNVRRNATGQAEGPAKRGFYSFFPLLGGRPNATVLARFSDNFLTQKGERQPFFAMQAARKGQVFYIGSAEIWRLRQFEEKYHERFWTKLLRHMGRGEQARGTRRGFPILGSKYLEGETVDVEAQLYNAQMQPLVPDAKTKVLLKVTPPEGTQDPPREWAEGLPMKSDSGRPGWFRARFQVKRAGKYAIQIGIPGSLDVLEAAFRVESTDPERDQTRPDFAPLQRTASEARGVRLLDEKKRPDFLKALATARNNWKKQAKEPAVPAGSASKELEEDRLFFDLETAQWVPEALDSNIVPFRAEGKVTDLWDKGWSVFQNIHEPEKATGLPWALTLIVTLLGLEWLARKLLKLA